MAHISFRFLGRKFKRSLKTKRQREALARKARLEESIRLVSGGLGLRRKIAVRP